MKFEKKKDWNVGANTRPVASTARQMLVFHVQISQGSLLRPKVLNFSPLPATYRINNLNKIENQRLQNFFVNLKLHISQIQFPSSQASHTSTSSYSFVLFPSHLLHLKINQISTQKHPILDDLSLSSTHPRHPPLMFPPLGVIRFSPRKFNLPSYTSLPLSRTVHFTSSISSSFCRIPYQN